MGISLNAPATAIKEAYARLEERYQPEAFAEYGNGAVTAATSIVRLIHDAYEKLAFAARLDVPEALPRLELESKSRADETLRALATLRAAIARRLNDAQAHRAAGRLADAIRVFESVMILDRHNPIARQSLIELRRYRDGRSATVLGRLLACVLRRDAHCVSAEPIQR